MDASEISRQFLTEGFAINIHTFTVFPGATGGASIHVFLADRPSNDIVDVTFNELSGFFLTNFGAGEEVEGPPQTKYKAMIPFKTSDITEKSRSYSVWPVFSQLAIGWDADVDFTVEIDYTILPVMLDFRQIAMELLRNKRQVQDPNIDATQGKRSLVRAGLRLAEN